MGNGLVREGCCGQVVGEPREHAPAPAPVEWPRRPQPPQLEWPGRPQPPQLEWPRAPQAGWGRRGHSREVLHPGCDDISPGQPHPAPTHHDDVSGADLPLHPTGPRRETKADRLEHGVPGQHREHGVVCAQVEVETCREDPENARLTRRSLHGSENER
ncbi:hypothetical protein IDVR_19890 [Intrasporangium sp. DVR]